MLKTERLSAVLTVLLFLISGSCLGRTITVDGGATGENDGSSWADAYTQLQSALAVASSGDEIRVAKGVYKPAGISGDCAATFQLLNGITIKGGYAGLSSPDPNIRDIDAYETILSGDLNGDDDSNFANNSENSYHVLTGSGTDATAILDGFTITGGNANGISPQSLGGGMYNSYGNPTIINCTFIRNYSLVMGGGMFNYESSPAITNCSFIENISDDDGGGIRNYTNSHTIITNCYFIDNVAFEDGGGLNNRKNSNAIVTNCMFIGNTAGSGGGMENHVGRAAVTGVPIITNCTFVGNTGSEGGGMRNNDANPIINNCTFVGNTGSGMNNRKNNPSITNCIFWANTGGSFDGSGKPVVTYSNVEGGFVGTDNINANPSFVQLGYSDANDLWVEGDYHLLPGSPCIDAGDPAFVSGPNETDIDGQPRVNNGRIDIGAYEYQGVSIPDNNSPTPDPMTWATPPYATGSTSIAMVATTASDVSGVEYYFASISGGGYDSGWQDSTMYEDTGLDPNTLYTYQVKARDKSVNRNETVYSTAESATTDVGCTAGTVYVESIVCGTAAGSRGKKYGQVTVAVHDSCGNPILGADVTGTFTGDFNETLTKTTNSTGVAVLTTTTQIKKPSYTFCVDSITHATLTYSSVDSVETCDNR